MNFVFGMLHCDEILVLGGWSGRGGEGELRVKHAVPCG